MNQLQLGKFTADELYSLLELACQPLMEKLEKSSNIEEFKKYQHLAKHVYLEIAQSELVDQGKEIGELDRIREPIKKLLK